MSGLGLLPRDESCTGEHFVEVARSLYASEREARLMWRRIVQVVRGARYTVELAFTESLTLGQLSDFKEAGPQQLPHLKDGEWGLASTAIATLCEGRGYRPAWIASI